MKIEIDLPEDFLAWLDRLPLCAEGSLDGASVADKLRWLLEDEIRRYHQEIEWRRHEALLRLLGVENLFDVGNRDDDIPF